MRFRLPAVLLVPFQITGLVSFQPLKEPSLRPIQPGIDFLRRLFFLHVLHNRELPDLFHVLWAKHKSIATVQLRPRDLLVSDRPPDHLIGEVNVLSLEFNQ